MTLKLIPLNHNYYFFIYLVFIFEVTYAYQILRELTIVMKIKLFLLKKISPFWGVALAICLFGNVANTSAQIRLDFKEPIIVNGGANLEVGTQYRFQNVGETNGSVAVDALVTITNANAASLDAFDDDISHLGTGTSDFNPIIQLNDSQIINGSNDGAYVEFLFEFVLNSDNSTPAPIALDVYAYDIDGDNFSLREYIEITNLNSYTVNGTTDVTYSPVGRFESTTGLLNNGLNGNAQFLGRAEYLSVSSFSLRSGVLRDSGSSTQERLAGIAFQPITFSDPITILLDTDGDGIVDNTEFSNGSDLNNPCDPAQQAGYSGFDSTNTIWQQADCDGDGVNNITEFNDGDSSTDPYCSDNFTSGGGKYESHFLFSNGENADGLPDGIFTDNISGNTDELVLSYPNLNIGEQICIVLGFNQASGKFAWSLNGEDSQEIVNPNGTIGFQAQEICLTVTEAGPQQLKIGENGLGAIRVDGSTYYQCRPPDTDGDGIPDSSDLCAGFDDNTDTDGDGIPDGCDEDDDNDGILDVVECPYNILWISDGFLTSAEQNVVDKLIALGHIVSIADDNDSNNANDFDVVFIFEDVSSGNVVANLQNLVSTVNGIVTTEVALHDDLFGGATGSEVPTSIVQITNNAHFITNGIDIGDYNIANANNKADINLSSGTVLGTHPSGGASIAFWKKGDPTDSGTAAGRRVIVPNGNESGIIFNEQGEDLLVNAILWAAVESDFALCDADNDTQKDSKDTDSDNDSCFDALEGDAEFTLNDIDANGRLIGGVNSNSGIPTIAGIGQADVSSKNENVLSGACTEDTDGDGITDFFEISNGTDENDPCDPEQLAGYTGYDGNNTIWRAADCDGDDVLNGNEFDNGTDPYAISEDTDGDGLDNDTEADLGTDENNPCDPAWASGYTGFDGSNPIWRGADCDADGVLNGDEFDNGTDPYSPSNDTDGDGIDDDTEINNGTDENDSCDPEQLAGYTGYNGNNAIWRVADCDNDGVLNGDEFDNDTDPYSVSSDTDGDGIDDDTEINNETDENNPCDPDQLAGYTGFDGNNVIWRAADCDNDGVLNGDEFDNGTDPYLAPGDDDNDGVPNDTDLCPGTPDGETVNANGCSDSQLDDDNDGVPNDTDICPDTPDGEAVDANGCSDSQLDDDNDGVPNDTDICPDTPDGETVNANGCSDSQLDDDNDGVPNDTDLCPDTPDGEAVDANGCSDSQLDDDNDGVPNDADLCPDTPDGEAVDANGCSDSQLDDDNDGVPNDTDICPDTPDGETVDANGCSDSQLDDDNDGVPNDTDICPDTPDGETVDANGCSDSQLDDDNDGVPNDADLCPDTPDGETVDANGCSDSQLDDDNDGVPNDTDICPDTPDGETVDANGCSDSQLDDDNDGVPNDTDLCPDTPEGEIVDADGCSESESIDTDGDGISDDQEAIDETDENNPCDPVQSPGYNGYDSENTIWGNADCDGDGVINIDEFNNGTDPYLASGDTDGDGISDDAESHNGSDPNDPCDPVQISGYEGFNSQNTVWSGADCDEDGVSNGDEVTNGTDPFTASEDTDGDGLIDDLEINDNTDTNNPCDPSQEAGYVGFDANNTIWGLADCDGDGILNGDEVLNGTDPYLPDNEGTSEDSDGDGISDDQEAIDGTDPSDSCDSVGGTPSASDDCDGDGLTNAEETIGLDDPDTPANPNGQLTDPENPDTDGDGISDGQESLDNTNPNDACNSIGEHLRLTLIVEHYQSLPI